MHLSLLLDFKIRISLKTHEGFSKVESSPILNVSSLKCKVNQCDIFQGIILIITKLCLKYKKCIQISHVGHNDGDSSIYGMCILLSKDKLQVSLSQTSVSILRLLMLEGLLVLHT